MAVSGRHVSAGHHRGDDGEGHGGVGGERAGGGAGRQGAGLAGLDKRAQHRARFSPIAPRRAHRPDSWGPRGRAQSSGSWARRWARTWDSPTQCSRERGPPSQRQRGWLSGSWIRPHQPCPPGRNRFPVPGIGRAGTICAADIPDPDGRRQPGRSLCTGLQVRKPVRCGRVTRTRPMRALALRNR